MSLTWMSKNYDNWERLVTAVVRREQDLRLALASSRDTSSVGSSLSTDLDLSFSSSSQLFNHDPLPMDWKLILPPEKQEFVWTTLGLRIFDDEITGKNCLLLGVTYMKIKAFGVNKFSKKFHLRSRMGEVVEIIYERMIHIKGAIQSKMLSPSTLYSAYLVFGLIENHRAPYKAYASIIFLCDNSRKESQLIFFRQGKCREDGWMEIHLGNLYVDGDNGEIEVKLVDIDVPWKSCLTIEGIEFRPNFE